MKISKIDSAPKENFNAKKWKPLINFFWNRYNKRYFYQIEYLQKKSTRKEIRNNCGFLITTIDCILIETLEQYYSGKDNTTDKKLHSVFLRFFNRVPDLKGIIENDKDAGLFYGHIRNGLMHQSKTIKASIINKKPGTQILEWIDSKEKTKGFKINRDKFHKCVYNEYKKLIEELKKRENSDLREKFKMKLKTIIES